MDSVAFSEAEMAGSRTGGRTTNMMEDEAPGCWGLPTEGLRVSSFSRCDYHRNQELGSPFIALPRVN